MTLHPTDDRRLPSIQALRGIAASAVVLYHWSGLFESLQPQGRSRIIQSGLGGLGACGVDIFFAISGFIMVYTTQNKSGVGDSLIFLKRRALRIYPLYWIWTTVLLGLWLAGFLQSQHYSIRFLVESYLLYPAFDGVMFRPLLGQGWTLSFEMLFYAVFAGSILLGLKRTKLPYLAAVFAVLMVCGRLLPARSGAAFLLTNPILLEFLYGVLVAEIVLRSANSGRLRRHGVPWILCSLGCILLLCTLKTGSEHGRCLYWGIPAFMIVLGAALRGTEHVPVWLVFLGDASYSIYLAHIVCAMFFDWVLVRFHLAGRVSPDLAIVLAVAITIVLCSLTYRWMEKPLLRILAPKKLASQGESELPERLSFAQADTKI